LKVTASLNFVFAGIKDGDGYPVDKKKIQ